MKRKFSLKHVIIPVLLLFLAGFPAAEKTAVLLEIKNPLSLDIDGKQLFVNEKDALFIYSMDDFKSVKKLGVNDYGPAAGVGQPLLTAIYPDYLILDDIIKNKLLFFSRDGIFKKEVKTPPDVYNFYPVGANYIGSKEDFNHETMITNKSVNIYAPDFKTLNELSKWEGQDMVTFPQGSTKKIDFEVVRDCFKYVVYEDRVYLADTRKGFYIAVYDSSGKKLYEINKEYDKKKVTAEFKSKYTKKDDTKPSRVQNLNFVFPDYFPAFEKFEVKTGKIYAWTHEQKENKQELLILDLQGNVLKKVFLARQCYYSLNDYKYYYLLEGSAGECELHAEAIE